MYNISSTSVITASVTSLQNIDNEDAVDSQRNMPNRSVYNLIYDNEMEDDDDVTHSTRSYLEEEDIPLPVLQDSNSSVWSRFGQCCDCCDACLRKQKVLLGWNCGWVRTMVYYLVMNILIAIFFFFVMYMITVTHYQNPDVPPFKQLKFKTNQYPGIAMVPSMVNMYSVGVSAIWYGMKGNDSSRNRRAAPYVSSISKYIHLHSKACETAKRCNLKQESWGPCEAPDYGYSAKTPCIFLKINRLTLWQPEEYGRKSEIPKDVPEKLRSVIEVDSARLWINCQGETTYDQDLIGDVEYYPGSYYNSSFFPLTSDLDTNPAVAIQLSHLKSGHIAKLVCGVYAKNVKEHAAHYTYIYVKDD